MGSSKTPGAKILFLAPSYGATGWYRCNVPGKELAKIGHTVHLDLGSEPDVVAGYDVLVISNGSNERALELLQHARSAGVYIVADIDDDPWHMTDANPNIMHFDETERMSLEAVLSQADCVTTTNPFLADFVSSFGSSVIVLPNCLPGEYWHVAKCRHPKTVIGWIGGLTHYDDLLLVAEPINRLLTERSDIEFHLTVFEEHPFQPKTKVKILPATLNLPEYPALFAGIDIGIAPLVDNHFNRSKSDLKFLEYGAARVPCVASDVSTYSRAIRPGQNGFLAANSAQWIEHLTRLIDDATLREQIATEARKTAEERFIDKQIHLWEKTYSLPTSGL